MTSDLLDISMLRFDDHILHGLQQVAGMPYHPPTLQFAPSEMHTQRLVPVNPLAKSILAVFRHSEVTAGQVEELEACGFAVEVRS